MQFRLLTLMAYLVALTTASATTAAQQASPPQPQGAAQSSTPPSQLDGTAPANAEALIRVPVSGLFPGGIAHRPVIADPAPNDKQSIERGRQYFTAMNCVGCHAPHGGGGMGPALSNRNFIYGDRPENIFLSILQGRPKGMPAWGASLPQSVIWDLVHYIKSISQEPTPEWGKTFSRNPQSPRIEQIPAERTTTNVPWKQTEPFSNGQKPQ